MTVIKNLDFGNLNETYEYINSYFKQSNNIEPGRALTLSNGAFVLANDTTPAACIVGISRGSLNSSNTLQIADLEVLSRAFEIDCEGAVLAANGEPAYVDSEGKITNVGTIPIGMFSRNSENYKGTIKSYIFLK
jgi:hypothetical protein